MLLDSENVRPIRSNELNYTHIQHIMTYVIRKTFSHPTRIPSIEEEKNTTHILHNGLLSFITNGTPFRFASHFDRSHKRTQFRHVYSQNRGKRR